MIVQVQSYTIEARCQPASGPSTSPAIRFLTVGGPAVVAIYSRRQDGSDAVRTGWRERPWGREFWSTLHERNYAIHLDILRNESPVAIVLGGYDYTLEEMEENYFESSIPWSLLALNEPVGEGPTDSSRFLQYTERPIWDSDSLERWYPFLRTD